MGYLCQSAMHRHDITKIEVTQTDAPQQPILQK